MKIYLLSPVASQIFNPDFIRTLKPLGTVVIDDKIKSLSKVTGMTDSEDKIIALDPGFCDWQLKESDISSIPNIKAICLQSTSFSWLDNEYCRQLNIPVVNIKNYSTNSVAEWAVMLAMLVARKIPLVIKNNWNYDFTNFQGIELTGKTAGIIGLGHIGRSIANICQGLGMKVIYWSKNSRDSQLSFADLPTLLKTSDLIFPCLAQNQETQGLITDNLLLQMKPSAIFVSIVHTVYNHQLLLDLVKQNKIYGYAFEESKPAFSSYEGNVWAGPELAWCTAESLQRNHALWIENIVNAAKGNFPNRIN
ncbi:MAG: NAD(P)-dependent oxidoreductase [Candidatus Shapirobacteria bacterium]|jgi:phosphoglycerate dehydrogenase-like enzyme